MSEVYSSELSELTERCKQISSELSKSDEIEDNISSFLPIIRKYTGLTISEKADIHMLG